MRLFIEDANTFYCAECTYTKSGGTMSIYTTDITEVKRSTMPKDSLKVEGSFLVRRKYFKTEHEAQDYIDSLDSVMTLSRNESFETCGLNLKKTSAGHYKTADGKYEIEKSDGFWYAVDTKTGQSVVDCENSLSAIKDSLESYIKSQSKKESIRRKRVTEGKRILSKDEYDYWFNVGLEAFKRGDMCVPANSKELIGYFDDNPTQIGSDEWKRHEKMTLAWLDGWTKGNLSAPVESVKHLVKKSNICESVDEDDSKWFTDMMDTFTHTLQRTRPYTSKHWKVSGYSVPETDRSSGEIRNVSYGIVFSSDIFGKWEDLILLEYFFTGFDNDIRIKISCAKLGIMDELLKPCNPNDVVGDKYAYLNSNIDAAVEVEVESCIDQLRELSNDRNESLSRRSIKEGDASKKTNYAVMVYDMNTAHYSLFTGTKARCEQLLNDLEAFESFADDCENEEEYFAEEEYIMDLLSTYNCIPEIYQRQIDDNSNYSLGLHYGSNSGNMVHIINEDNPISLYL